MSGRQTNNTAEIQAAETAITHARSAGKCGNVFSRFLCNVVVTMGLRIYDDYHWEANV